MIMNDKVYDLLRLIALCIVPITSFVTAVAQHVGFDATIILLTITLIDSLLGVFIEWSRQKYNKEGDLD